MPLRRFLASLAFASLVLLAQGAAAERFRVLVVMSYEQDNPWVREIREGIDGVLGAHADVTYFHMDTKVHPAGASRKGEEAMELYRRLQPHGVIAADDDAQAKFVPGSALHRERMALPPDAVFEATLQDVSRADAAAEVLGRARLDPAGQSPFRFEIPYDAARIAAGRRYVVRAEIRHEGRLLFTTDVAHPVLGAGAGREVEIVLVRVAAADAAPLAGTRWRLVALGDEPVRAADASRAPHLVFAVEGGRLSGSDGCNRMVGGYALDGARLSFSGIGATRMACPEGMEQAAAFARALHATAAHRVAGDLLELIDASGRVVARLQAEPPR